jgi:negative regulator of sigma E activity
MYKAELVNSQNNNAEHLDYRHATYCHRNMHICRRHLIAVRGKQQKVRAKDDFLAQS